MASERRVRLSQEAWDALAVLALWEERSQPDTASRAILAAQRAAAAQATERRPTVCPEVSGPPLTLAGKLTALHQFAHKRGKR